MYKRILRPILFSADPENVHDLALRVARAAECAPCRKTLERICGHDDARLAVRAFGLDFPNPIGLAAGFDKEAEALPFFSALGFGYIEVGTVTAQPQPGNPKPRIFRLPADGALINRMGFPSDGADVVAARLEKLAARGLRARIGINIGKSKVVPLDQALDDYRSSFARLRHLGDLFVVNISSPNTPELRKLQQRERLAELLRGIQEINQAAKPLLVKVAPDLSWQELDEVLECCEVAGVAGLVATNTTLAREGLNTSIDESGGLSGRPLSVKAREFVSYVSARMGDRLPVAAVGGVSSAADVIELFRRGASLVQVYTAFIYEGPYFVKRLCTELSRFLDKEQLSSLTQLRP